MGDLFTTYMAVVGAITGSIGTAIGVWNLWLTRKSHRVRMVLHASVQPVASDSCGHPQPVNLDEADGIDFKVRVENRSYFAVRLTECGLMTTNGLFRRYDEIVDAGMSTPMIEGRDHYKWSFRFELPRREPGEKTIGKGIVDDATHVYVKTVTGDTFYGCRKEISQLRALISQFYAKRTSPNASDPEAT